MIFMQNSSGDGSILSWKSLDFGFLASRRDDHTTRVAVHSTLRNIEKSGFLAKRRSRSFDIEFIRAPPTMFTSDDFFFENFTTKLFTSIVPSHARNFNKTKTFQMYRSRRNLCDLWPLIERHYNEISFISFVSPLPKLRFIGNCSLKANKNGNSMSFWFKLRGQ